MKTRIIKEVIRNNDTIYDTQYRCEQKILFWWVTMQVATWSPFLRMYSYRDAIFSTYKEAEEFIKEGNATTIKEIVSHENKPLT